MKFFRLCICCKLSAAVTLLHDLQGIRNVPTKLRIQISRKRNDDEDAKVSLRTDSYCFVMIALSYAVLYQMAGITTCKASVAAHLQEDMYSYVTVADEQQFKSKGTEVVDS